ncbi:MAG TPA: hypothetical protein VJX70_12255 [Candidatus Acidoferrum sp.]|nr:hypothetical protein [Candidatus Acidoferrum sp.]
MPESAKPTALKPPTLEAFAAYIHAAEAELDHTLRGSNFLWADADPAKARDVREGHIVAEFWTGKGPAKIPHGLIHDWIGAAFLPATNIKEILSLIQDYDNHKNIYKPEVLDSKLLSRHQNDFQIYLRLLKKKILTVVLDTDHKVHYRSLDPARWDCRSHTTRIAEVTNAGTPQEKVLPPDTGYGFLWRLNSYWRFQERDAGVCVECRAISLSRDIPLGLGWIIEPIIEKLPKESLIHTLTATRQVLLSTAK